MNATTEKAQIRVTRSSAAYWRVRFDNPPLNLMGPQFIREFRETITAVEADEEVSYQRPFGGQILRYGDAMARHLARCGSHRYARQHRR